MRKPNDRVAARIQREMARVGEAVLPEGVLPLNPGYFTVERIRDRAAPKQRSVVRAQLSQE